MLDGETETLSEPMESIVWEDLVEVLQPQREKETEGQTPKAYNAKWKHFTFRRSYYNKILILSNVEVKEYVKAICELMFDGKQPKELSPVVRRYFDLSMLTLGVSIKKKKAGSKGGTTPRTKEKQHTVEDLKSFGCTGNLNINNPIMEGVDVNALYEFANTHKETHTMSLYKVVELFRMSH